MKNKLLFSIVLSLLFVSCASVSNQGIPSWFINQYDAPCNKTDFICAVGSGSSKEEAHENAKVALSQIFNTKIQNALVLYDSDNKSTLDSIGYVDTSVDDLIGLKLVNTYVNKDGVFFVRVALEKKLAINKLREIITPSNREIASLLASNNESDLTYLQNLLRAKKIAISIQQYFDQLSVLEEATVPSPLISVENKINMLKKNLSLDVKVESEDSFTKSQLEKAVQTMLINSGIGISNNSESLLILSYSWSNAPPKNGLYQCNFNLEMQVKEDSNTIISLEKQGRGIGISEENAQSKAIEQAISLIEGELFE